MMFLNIGDTDCFERMTITGENFSQLSKQCEIFKAIKADWFALCRSNLHFKTAPDILPHLVHLPNRQTVFLYIQEHAVGAGGLGQTRYVDVVVATVLVVPP
jgi:hypothetical protein